MKRKFIVLIILSSVLLTGCSDTSPKFTFEMDRFEYVEKLDECNLFDMYVIRDKETGVNYIATCGYASSTMCALYDSEGNVVVTEKKGDE